MVSREDFFKRGAYDLSHLHQAIRGLRVYSPVYNADISKELQKKRFYVFVAAIPEAGFCPPELGFQGITLSRPDKESRWKVNKNKENLVGATRFGMVTNLQ